MEDPEQDASEFALILDQMTESEKDDERRRLVDIANKVFGWLNWNHAVTSQTVDFIDCEGGVYSVGVSAVVKIELKNGTYHQEVGYGSSEGLRSKTSAISFARQDSLLRGLRSALLSFGGDVAENLLSTKISLKTYNQDNGGRTPKKPQTIKRLRQNEEFGSSISVKSANKSNTIQTSPVLNNLKNKSVSEEDSRLERTPGLSGLQNRAMTEEECRLERKRRQLQKQEQFRQQFKQQKIQHGGTNKNTPQKLFDKTNTCEWAAVIETPLAEEFLSTQEVEHMVLAKNVPLLSVAGNMRSPKDLPAVRPDSFMPKRPQINVKRSL